MAVARNLQEEAVKNAGQGTYVSDAQRQAQAKVQSYGDNPYAVFQESAKTKNAYNQLQNTLKNRPEDYTSNYTDTINNLLDQIVNRKEFSYDFNADPLYQAYKNQYTTAGKQAMKDTVAQTSAMTGGYGNSYSTTAGSQAYQGYLQQLNDRIPEIYAQALNKYQMEGEELRNKYNVVGQQEDREYGQWTDKMDFWDRDRTFGLNQYNSFWDQDMREQAFNSDNWNESRNFDYGRYRDIVGDDRYSYENSYKALKDAQDFDYQQARDAVGDQRWLDEFAYQQARDKVKDDQWAMEFALQQAKAAASGGRGGSSGKSSKDDKATQSKDNTTANLPIDVRNSIPDKLALALRSGETDLYDELKDMYENGYSYKGKTYYMSDADLDYLLNLLGNTSSSGYPKLSQAASGSSFNNTFLTPYVPMK